MEMTFAIYFSNAFNSHIHHRFPCHLIIIIFKSNCSCHILDDSKVYEKHLKDDKNPNYQMVMRMVQMVVNFAQTGLESTSPNESKQNSTHLRLIFINLLFGNS